MIEGQLWAAGRWKRDCMLYAVPFFLVFREAFISIIFKLNYCFSDHCRLLFDD